MNHTRLIIEREYLTQVKNKKFIIITLLIPFLFVGVGLFISFLTNINSDSICLSKCNSRVMTKYCNSIVVEKCEGILLH